MSNHRLLTFVQCFLLLQYLQPIIGACVTTSDDGYGKADDEDPEDGTEAAKHLTHPCLGHHVPIPHLRDRF